MTDLNPHYYLNFMEFFLNPSDDNPSASNVSLQLRFSSSNIIQCLTRNVFVTSRISLLFVYNIYWKSWTNLPAKSRCNLPCQSLQKNFPSLWKTIFLLFSNKWWRHETSLRVRNHLRDKFMFQNSVVKIHSNREGCFYDLLGKIFF